MRARTLLLLVAALLLAPPANTFAAKSGPLTDADYEGYATYFPGTYEVIGRLPRSGKAYTGKALLVANGKEFKVTRKIAGKTTHGRAFVDVDPVGRHIFVMEFTQAGHRYEATYLFENTFDNWPRLTGHVASPGHSRDDAPGYGLEALFPPDDPACATGV